MFNQSRALLLGSLAAVVLSANLARAGAVTEIAPTVSVVYSQTDLTSTRGVQSLYARLKSAALQVCPDGDSRDLMRAVPARQCYETALSAAVERVQRPELTALHLQSGHRSAG